MVLSVSSTFNFLYFSHSELYADSYELFCTEVIVGRILNNQEVLRMPKLLQIFKAYVMKQEGLETFDYRYLLFFSLKMLVIIFSVTIQITFLAHEHLFCL